MEELILVWGYGQLTFGQIETDSKHPKYACSLGVTVEGTGYTYALYDARLGDMMAGGDSPQSAVDSLWHELIKRRSDCDRWYRLAGGR